MASTQNSNILIDGPDGQLQLIHSIVSSNTNLKTLAIICHPHPMHGGTMNNKVVHIINKTFNNAGLNTIRFNFRGVEQSEGTFADGIGEVDDLIAVINWAIQNLEIDRCYLAGFSFGSYIAAQFATTLQSSKIKEKLIIEKLLLIAPPVSMYNFDAVDIKMPCLVVQGGQDSVVIPEQVKTWVASQQNNVELEWLDDAEHFFHGKLNFIRDVILNHWFKLMDKA